MTLAEWRKKKNISHYTLGQMLGFNSINPATNSSRYCLESKEKRLGEVKIEDLYKAWWNEETK
jgi:hypothetical protein